MVLIHAPKGLVDGSGIKSQMTDCPNLPPPDWGEGEAVMSWGINPASAFKSWIDL